MASYRGHLAFSTALGVAYGGAAIWYGMYWPAAVIGAGLTAAGGMLPDLDSDSGVPVRVMFTIAGVAAPLLLLRRILDMGLPLLQTVLLVLGLYLFVRYSLSVLFKRMTVHRGMFHSIPAMVIAGLIVFLAHHDPDLKIRVYLAVGVMIGFLSHLVLDELCSVDFSGVRVTFNKYAGSAVKFFGPSWTANVTTYLVLAGLGYAAFQDLGTAQPEVRRMARLNTERWRTVSVDLLERLGNRTAAK
jgi:membrane-bound metal-dependent hydrolase YbcI (DUF457 family)